MKIPTPVEAERGIASITLNHPELVLNSISDAAFNPTFIYDALSRDVVEVVLDQVSRRAVCDVRIIFENLRERNDSVQFHEVTELYTLMPIAGALKGLMEIVKNASKRRAVVAVLAEGMQFAESADVSTPELVNGLATGIERIRGEMTPPIRLDTQALIMDAITRYQERPKPIKNYF